MPHGPQGSYFPQIAPENSRVRLLVLGRASKELPTSNRVGRYAWNWHDLAVQTGANERQVSTDSVEKLRNTIWLAISDHPTGCGRIDDSI